MNTTTIRRRRPAKPIKPRKHETFHNSGTFNAETSNSMLMNFVDNVKDMFTGTNIVTVHVDNEGANLVFTGEGYQISLIYQEGGTV